MYGRIQVTGEVTRLNSSQLVVAENEIEAMLGTFSRTGDKQKERM